MRRSQLALPLLASLLVAPACGKEKPSAPPPTQGPAKISAAGGSVLGAGGVQVDVPADAFDREVTVTVESASGAPPAQALSPLVRVRFDPPDALLARPITLHFPLPAGTSAADVSWAPEGGTAASVGGEVVQGAVVAQLVAPGTVSLVQPSATRLLTGLHVRSMPHGGALQHAADDLSKTAIEAIAWVDGAPVTRAGQGGARGTFTIADVPKGEALVHVDGAYYATTGALDLGRVTFACPDAVAPAPGTSLSLDVTDAAPLGDFGVFPLLSPQAGVSISDVLLRSESPQLPAGATRVTAELDLAGDSDGVPALVEGSKGDRLLLGQVESADNDAWQGYRHMTRTFEPLPVDFRQGDEVLLHGAFSPLALDRALSIEVDGGAFVAALRSGGKCGSDGHVRLGVVGQAGGGRWGTFGATVQLAALDTQFDPTAPDVFGTRFPTGRMTYGLPRRDTYGAISELAYSCSFVVSAGDANVYADVSVVRQDPEGSLAEDVLAAPRLTAVRAISVAGQTLDQSREGVGLAPVLSWSAPDKGTADSYDVVVQHVTTDPRAHVMEALPVATLHTTATSVPLPPGVLQAGESYFLEVHARSSHGFLGYGRRGPLSDEASAVSSSFRP